LASSTKQASANAPITLQAAHSTHVAGPACHNSIKSNPSENQCCHSQGSEHFQQLGVADALSCTTDNPNKTFWYGFF